jgi:hypothetical protein
MKRLRKAIRKVIKNKNAVSQVLGAIMMILMLTSAIAIVWAWIIPAYNRFQRTNTVNSITSYMLRVDESVFLLLQEGEGATRTIELDPMDGEYRYEPGKDLVFTFENSDQSFQDTSLTNNLGSFTHWLFGMGGGIQIGDYKYLKGPSQQSVYFLNSSSNNFYSDSTNLTLSRPQDRTMKTTLDYRPTLYHWFDTNTETLEISISLLSIQPRRSELFINNYNALKIHNNRTIKTYSASAFSITNDFIVKGSLLYEEDTITENVLYFEKPTGIINYDVDISIQMTILNFYI